ncbi:MAG: hypothetical protein ACI9WC_001995 [Arenicella sp.]|jgi:hypothetical protein
MLNNSKTLLTGVLFLISSLASTLVHAQLTQLSVSGRVTLDSGVADKNYSVKVLVRRHTIDSVQSCQTFPFFSCTTRFTYPVSQTYATTVVMRAGTNSVGYRVNRGFLNGIKVSIKVECADCSTVIPSQYYTPQGSSLTLSNSALIDGNAVPARIDIALLATRSIKGRISLLEGEPLDKDLEFSVLVLSAYNDAFVASQSNLNLRAGATDIDYEVLGLPSETSISSYRVLLRCDNCSPAGQPTDYGADLAANSNHNNIDFVFKLVGSQFLPAVYLLLMDN